MRPLEIIKKDIKPLTAGFLYGMIFVLLMLLFGTICNAQSIDSTAYRMYIADRDRFLEQQETVKSKNMYLQLLGAITLLNMYIANEEKNFKFQLERK